MLNEVNGRRLRVDHPSHIVDTFEGISCSSWLIDRNRQIFKYATYLNNVDCQLFKLYDLCIDRTSDGGLLGNVVISEFMIKIGDKVPNSWTFNKSKGLKNSLANPAWKKRGLTKSQVVIIASRCSSMPRLVTGGGFTTLWPYFAIDCWTSWDALTKGEY